MAKNTNWGIAVDLRFKSGNRMILRNVTEVHYNYQSPAKEVMGEQVAFESAIHCTGCTYRIADVNEFETYPETRKEAAF